MYSATEFCLSGLTEPGCLTSCCVTSCLQNATELTEVCRQWTQRTDRYQMTSYSGDIMMPVTWRWYWLPCLFIVEGQNVIITGDCVYDITAFLLVIFQMAANSELRQKVLDLVSVLVSIKNGSLGLGLDKKVLFTRLICSDLWRIWKMYSFFTRAVELTC